VGGLGDGEFGANPAAAGEGVAERNPADFGRHFVGHQAIQPALRTGSRHFMLGERREVDDSDVLSQTQRLVAYVFEGVRAAEAPLVLRRTSGRSKPLRALPAVPL